MSLLSIEGVYAIVITDFHAITCNDDNVATYKSCKKVSVVYCADLEIERGCQDTPGPPWRIQTSFHIVKLLKINRHRTSPSHKKIIIDYLSYPFPRKNILICAYTYQNKMFRSETSFEAKHTAFLHIIFREG